MKKKRKHVALKIFLITLAVILALILGVLGFAYARFKHYYNLIDKPIDSEEIYDTIEPEFNDPPTTDDNGEVIVTPDTEIEGIHGDIDDVYFDPDDPTPPATNGNPGTSGGGDTPPPVVIPDIAFDKNVVNILLIGTDSRTIQDRGRSDTIMIATLNPNTKQIVLTSIVRDTYVRIPDKGYNRINAAYAYGGASLLMKTIYANFHLKLDKYIRVNFSGFEEAVNVMGGMTINITDKEIPYFNKYMKELNKLQGDKETDGYLDVSEAGKVNLNGRQTLAYCRIRYAPYVMPNGTKLDSDFGRTYRQRMVLSNMVKTAKGMSISQLNSILEAVLPHVATNMSEGEFLKLIAGSLSYASYDVLQYSLPVTGSWKYAYISGMAVTTCDLRQNIEALQKIFDGTYKK